MHPTIDRICRILALAFIVTTTISGADAWEGPSGAGKPADTPAVSTSTAAAASVVPAVTWTLEGGEARFEASASLAEIDGKPAAVSGKLTETGGKLAGAILADLTQLKTGIKLRDEHLHGKYLETAKHKHAKLELVGVDLVVGSKAPFCGLLHLKGKSARVCGQYELGVDGKLAAEFQLSLKPYGIVAWYEEIVVEDTVRVYVAATARKT